MPKREQHMIAIEPATMTVPTMDRPSIAFAWFLDNIVIETNLMDGRMSLACSLCSEQICDIKDSHTLRVILNTALAHGC